MGLKRSGTTTVSLVATFLCLATSVVSQDYPRPRGNTEVKRDLAILKRPPWNYVPGSPGTGCVEPNTFFDTDVVVDIQGDASARAGLDPGTLMDLEDAFMEAYNELRKGFCDDESRSVVEVQADENSVTIKGLNEFSLRFLVKGGCDLCATDTNLFEPEPDTRRKLLSNTPDDEKESGNDDSTEQRELRVFKRWFNYNNQIRGAPPPTPSPVNVAPPPTPSPVNAAIPVDPRTAGEECCPANGERRAPYASEFADAFDTTYKEMNSPVRRLQTGSIQNILAAIELLSVVCEEPLEEFEANVEVELGGNLTAADESEILAIEASFRASYNGFGEILCDPFYRSVTEVTAELDDPDVRYLAEEGDEQQDRELQSRRLGRFKYRVKGKCRGCGGGNRRLFAQGSSGRRLEMKYDRQLQFVFDDDTCFCAVGAEERGIFEDEFTDVYDTNIQELNEEGVLTNIESVEGVEEELLWTWSPTESPTNFPTGPTDSPVPSPSPSMEPTS